MKSMLHEASSIIKAIEKAWMDSGQPSEFTIKVLETGEKHFLWFSKKPSIVSITYDPKKQAHAQQSPERKNQQSSLPPKPHQTSTRSKPAYHNQNTRATPPEQQSSPKQRFQTREIQVKAPRENKEIKETSIPLSKKPLDSQPVGWTPEFINQILEHLKELTSILKLDTIITTKADNKTLFIAFSKKLAPTPEDEKMLFISISYLLMQFLKKKFKKKLKNFHLVLTSKESPAYDKAQSGTAE